MSQGEFAALLPRRGRTPAFEAAVARFGAERATVATGGGYARSTAVAADDGDVTVFVKGDLFAPTLDTLPALYRQNHDAFARTLDGSFAALVLDRREGSATVVTDPVNSKRVFLAEADDFLWVTTSLAELPLAGFPLDIRGIASYLASGSTLNGRTLYECVRVLERAAIHVMTPRGVRSRQYWRYEFDGSHARRDLASLRRELGERVVASVRKRWRAPEAPYLSLSAGVDSRAILGVFAEELRAVEVRCFSYARGEPKPRSDAAIARELARRYAYPHATVESYGGDLLGMLSANAELGHGLANLCEEVDAWLRLSAGPRADVFVGDECFGWVDARLASPSDVLETVSIRGFRSLAWIRGLVSRRVYRQLREALATELDEIYARSPDTPDLHDRKDFLYLDQRVCHVLMPWREFFTARLGAVQTPFLDRDILEFMTGVPSAMRRDKRLYRESIALFFPSLVAVERAGRSGYLVNWNRELAAHEPRLTAELLATESRLDDVVPREALLSLLAAQARPGARARYAAKKVLDYGRSRESALGALVTRTVAGTIERVDPATLLMRSLVLRRALAG